MDELLDVLIESGGKMTFNIGIVLCFFVYFLPLEVKEIYHIRQQSCFFFCKMLFSTYHFAFFCHHHHFQYKMCQF